MPKKRLIALFLDLADYCERLCFQGIEQFAEEHGPWEYDSATGSLGAPVADLRTWRGDGVVGFLRTGEIGRQLAQSKLPAVNISNLDPGRYVPAVRRDATTVGVLAAEHFLHRGLENFAYYSAMTADMDMKRLEEHAFAERLKQDSKTCSILFQPSTAEPQKDPGRIHRELLDWLQSLSKPVGIVATGDLRAARVLAACRQLRLRVPQDVAVLGRGNDELLCRFTRPTLSSIGEDYAGIGYRAAELLSRLMDGGKPPAETVLVACGPIVERESTRILVTGDVHVRQALRYIAEHACDPITVTDVVRQLPIGRTRLEVLFRQAVHRTPRSEIIRVRMERARRLLADTNRPVARVAADCGFAGYSSFSIAFKREVGVSPRGYRRRHGPQSR